MAVISIVPLFSAVLTLVEDILVICNCIPVILPLVPSAFAVIFPVEELIREELVSAYIPIKESDVCEPEKFMVIVPLLFAFEESLTTIPMVAFSAFISIFPRLEAVLFLTAVIPTVPLPRLILPFVLLIASEAL